MNRPTSFFAALAAGALLASCASAPEPPAGTLEEARRIAATVPANLLAMLGAEIGKGGAEGAIEACRVKAPEMARAASEQTGWNVRRASLRNRNPKGVPDAWERTALEGFDARVARGENPAALETWQVVDEGGRRVFRYAKALPTQPFCLQCHGDPAAMSEAVRTKLRALYPQDLAVGYSAGQVRGGLFLKKPL